MKLKYSWRDSLAELHTSLTARLMTHPAARHFSLLGGVFLRQLAMMPHDYDLHLLLHLMLGSKTSEFLSFTQAVSIRKLLRIEGPCPPVWPLARPTQDVSPRVGPSALRFQVVGVASPDLSSSR